MAIKIGILCSQEGLELAVLIAAVDKQRLPAEIKIVIADRESEALKLAREVGLHGVFVPRAAFHANRNGFERRLVELLREAEVEVVVLSGFQRELGPVFLETYGGHIYGHDLSPEELVPVLEKQLREELFTLTSVSGS